MVQARFKPPFSIQQQKFLAICPKVTSVPSMVGSLYIMQHALRSRKRRKRVYQRILISMSCMDFIYSVRNFLSTWIIPASTGFYGAAGTTQTCTAAGFFGHGAALSSAIYNGTLTVYFLLTIAYGWKQAQLHKIEVGVLHGIPLTIGWSTAIASLPLLLFNPIGWTCWIGQWPLTCTAIPEQECTRGNNAFIYRWAFFHAILWLCFAFVIVAMTLIYCKIRKQEKVVEKYRHRASASAVNRGGGNSQALWQDNQSSSMQMMRRVDEGEEKVGGGGGIGSGDGGKKDKDSSTHQQTEQQHHHHRVEDVSSMGFRHPSSHQQQSSVEFNISNCSQQQQQGPQQHMRPHHQSQQHPQQDGSSLGFSISHTTLQRRRITSSRNSTGAAARAKNRERLSRRFGIQAMYYILAFFAAWIFPMVQFLVAQTNGGLLLFPLLAVSVILNPLQGFMNALIYIRPRYVRYKKELQQRRRTSPSPGTAAGQQQQQQQQQQEGGEGSLGTVPRSIPRSLLILLQAVSVNARDDDDDLEEQEEADDEYVVEEEEEEEAEKEVTTKDNTAAPDDAKYEDNVEEADEVKMPTEEEVIKDKATTTPVDEADGAEEINKG